MIRENRENGLWRSLFFFFREERGQRVKEIVVPSIDLDCEEEMGQNVEVQSVRTEATLGARDYD